jgi:hypothetical protein
MTTPTPIDQIRSASRKIVTSPITGNEYLIRRIDQVDFNRHQVSTLLPADDATEFVEPRFLTRIIDAVQYSLEKGADVFFGDEAATPDGKINANWIAPDQGFLSDEILKFSGLDDESSRKLKDLIKNGNGSGKPTLSPESSADSRTNSSASDPSTVA